MKRSAPLRRTGFGSRGDRKPLSRGKSWHRPELEVKREEHCRNCGSSHGVQLHHIVPRSLSRIGRSDPRNLLSLCAACHDGFHAGTPIPRSILTPEEVAFVEEIAPSVGWLGRRYPRSTTSTYTPPTKGEQ